jgi:hypothetical protein
MHAKATVTERQLVQAVEFDGRNAADIRACMEREGYPSETCAAAMAEEELALYLLLAVVSQGGAQSEGAMSRPRP